MTKNQYANFSIYFYLPISFLNNARNLENCLLYRGKSEHSILKENAFSPYHPAPLLFNIFSLCFHTKNVVFTERFTIYNIKIGIFGKLLTKSYEIYYQAKFI